MNILALCNYPILNPQHGGQLRVSNIINRYRTLGHHVEVAGVLGSASYEPEGGFLPHPNYNQLATLVPNLLLMEDYAIGRLFADDIKHRELLTQVIQYEPDIVHVEQPWLFSFARQFVDNYSPRAKIIYGSQNVEWRLKYDILSAHTENDIAKRNAELVKAIELNAIKNADAVVCVSESDAEWIGAQTKKPVVLAPNGVKAWQAAKYDREKSSVVAEGHSYCLYCASAHAPNMTGFFDMFSGGFGSLKPDEKLVIVGGAGLSIAEDIKLKRSAKLAEKVIVTGIISQLSLNGLLDGATCIILPLTQGGGTNLKTAEALWAGKHIVATSIAMRGFERFIGSRGIHLANDPETFKRSLRFAMGSEPLILDEHEIDDRSSVLWQSCLKPLDGLISKLTDRSQK